MKRLVSKNNRICFNCRYWNNGRGCPSMEVKPGGFFEVDFNDNQTCFKTGFSKPPWAQCHDFKSNY